MNEKIGEYESLHAKLRVLGFSEETIQIFADDQRLTAKELERAKQIATELEKEGLCL